MSEKKSNIKSGLNIDVDNGNVIVLNDVSVAEKEEKVQENKVQENTVKEEPIVPDVKITPEVKEPDINNIPLPEVPSINQTPDFIVPTVNTPNPAPVIEPVTPTPIMQTTPEIKPEPVQYSNNNFNSASNNDLYGQSFNKLPDNENRIFKSKGDVEKLSEEVANEIKNTLNAHVVYPMKATTDLLHEIYDWGRAVTDNGLNRQLLEDYDALKKKYSDLESVCNGEKSLSDIKQNNNFNNFSNNFNDTFNNKSNDDYNDFGGFGGFGRAA